MRRAEAGTVDPEVLWEPSVAVFCDGPPERLYARIARDAAAVVRDGGLLLLELPGRGSKPIVEAVGLLDHFGEVYGPDLDALTETKATKLAKAVSDLGLADEPGSVVMVGDTRFDIEAGTEVGTATVGVLWGIGSREELVTAGAASLAASPSNLLDLVAG